MAQKIQKILSLFDWDTSPLIPAIAQDSDTKQVLMLAFMDKKALNLTLQSGEMHYFSRSKNRIWKKGEQSGHFQIVQKILIDCDNDALVFLIKQKGVACHTGQKSCFFREIDFDKSSVKSAPKSNPNYGVNYGVIDDLYHTLLERKNANPKTSYTAMLYQKGTDTIAKKIIEEASEVALALKDCDFLNSIDTSDKNSQANKDCKQDSFTKSTKKSKIDSTTTKSQNPHSHLVYECADLLYHSLVALAKHNIHPEQVKNELARRFNCSGLAEKASRTKSSAKSKTTTKASNKAKSSKPTKNIQKNQINKGK
ncbi:bifunctional phosphoribosyl-AMP cyclohydrolase/phosphoribosyl-ATP diphosphatase HisIE [Helicobacter sp. T3_23-1059]